MKIFSAKQTRELDAYTIQHEPIASIDLMERASLTFVEWYVNEFPDTNSKVSILCGPGNNGGDGLAVARLLHQAFYNVSLFLCEIGNSQSEDFQKNLSRIPKRSGIPITTIKIKDPFPDFSVTEVLIDAVFGTGLNRPVKGYWADLFNHLNKQEMDVVSIDLPSGMFSDQHSTGAVVQADKTLTFQMPKLALLFPENEQFAGEWYYQGIGLSEAFIAQQNVVNHYVDQKLARSIYKKRKKFDHKGTNGHALLVMGSYGKIGAALLAGKACLRIGAGLVSIHSPICAYFILQTGLPEAMVILDEHEHYFTKAPELAKYNAIGIGCGLDTRKVTLIGLKDLLKETEAPMVIDADALNLIAQNLELIKLVPKQSVLTPHPREFQRLFGKTTNDFERNELQRQKAKELNCVILLKGAHTCVADADGTCYFNSSGNPGLATAGSGDVLTGIITGLLAQDYSPIEATILGVYLHGLAADLAVQDKESMESLIAGDISEYLGRAYDHLSSD